MNEVVVIDEIAKQLGMAADQVSGHVAELWPVYVSGLQAKSIGVLASVVVLGLLLPAIVAMVTTIMSKKTEVDLDWVEIIQTACFLWIIVGVVVTVIMSVHYVPYLINPEGTTLVNLVGMLKG